MDVSTAQGYERLARHTNSGFTATTHSPYLHSLLHYLIQPVVEGVNTPVIINRMTAMCKCKHTNQGELCDSSMHSTEIRFSSVCLSSLTRSTVVELFLTFMYQNVRLIQDVPAVTSGICAAFTF